MPAATRPRSEDAACPQRPLERFPIPRPGLVARMGQQFVICTDLSVGLQITISGLRLESRD
jgi:hypothetical protein